MFSSLLEMALPEPAGQQEVFGTDKPSFASETRTVNADIRGPAGFSGIARLFTQRSIKSP
jgi:hypothetical protein